MKIYIILLNNELCIKLLNKVISLPKPVHALCQCIDKGSFLKMTSFIQLVFTRVLVKISSLPIAGGGHGLCAEAKIYRISLVSPDLSSIEQVWDELWLRIRDCSLQPWNLQQLQVAFH